MYIFNKCNSNLLHFLFVLIRKAKLYLINKKRLLKNLRDFLTASFFVLSIGLKREEVL